MIDLYFKFKVPYKTIHEKLRKGNYKRVRFYIDLPNICRGFYNARTVEHEIGNYLESQQLPQTLFNEANRWYQRLRDEFVNYNPFFITFYDSGECQQNRTLLSGYKNRGSTYEKILDDEDKIILYRKIKNYYLMEFIPKFTIPNLSTVVYMDRFEADFIPYVCILNNIFNSSDSTTLNVILSTDKDLSQCCQFPNTIQCATVFSGNKGKINWYVLDKHNAISYIHKSAKRGLITADYIPLVLAIAGDKADGIHGIKGVGPAGACKMLLRNNTPAYPKSVTDLPIDIDRKEVDQIYKNYLVTSFYEQYKRIPLIERENLIQTLKSQEPKYYGS